MAGQVVTEILGTAVADPRHELDQWEDEVRRTCGTVQLVGERHQFGRGIIDTGMFGGVRVSMIKADPHTVIRHDKVASNEGGYMYVATPLSGRARLCQDGAEVYVGAGDVVAFDSSRSYTLTMPEPFAMVAVRTSHKDLSVAPEQTRTVTASPWSGGFGVGALAGQTFAALGCHLNELDEAAREPLGATVSGLITTLFSGRLSSSEDDPSAARQLLVLRICSFAKKHLGDSSLCPAMLARRYHISLRYLQILFAEQGTSPAKWIRDQRLDKLRIDLGDPRYDQLTVAAIGIRWGLADASQVSRLFRMKYGLSPRDYRRRCGRGEAVAD